jgi:hypothetical protein
MSAELYKMVIIPKCNITGYGVKTRQILKAYTYQVNGKVKLTTQQHVAKAYNEQKV